MSTFLGVLIVVVVFVLGGIAALALIAGLIHYYLNETINGPRSDK